MTEEEATAQMDGDEEYEEELYEFDETMDPEEIKKKLLEMDEEVNKLDKMQKQVEQQITSASDKIDETSM